MIVTPHNSAGDGRVHWEDLTELVEDADLPRCEWLGVQVHRKQSKPMLRKPAELIRKMAGDPHYKMCYRVITLNRAAPWFVLAVSRDLESIHADFRALCQLFAAYPELPNVETMASAII
ncbi:MAG: hypothetical protein Q8P67_21560, partial [archaeon]|nr:hypothetical protein [archaeon]